jgi:hypothetical protein
VRRIPLLAILLFAACEPTPPAVPPDDGYQHLTKGGSYECGPQPVSFDGSHADVTLTGTCTGLRVVGWHNGVLVSLPPGASVEFTGSHNDVEYILAAPGPAPQVVNSGTSNDVRVH